MLAGSRRRVKGGICDGTRPASRATVTGVRTVRLVLALAAVLAAVVVARAVLGRPRRGPAAEVAADRWPAVPRKPEHAS